MATSLKNYPTSNVGTIPVIVYNPTLIASDIYDPNAPKIQSTVVGMILANVTTIPVKASVFLVSSDVTVYIIKNVSIPVGNSLSVVGDSKVILEQDDILQVQSSANNSIDVILSVIEVVL